MHNASRIVRYHLVLIPMVSILVLIAIASFLVLIDIASFMANSDRRCSSAYT